jgi:hypothetical protein
MYRIIAECEYRKTLVGHSTCWVRIGWVVMTSAVPTMVAILSLRGRAPRTEVVLTVSRLRTVARLPKVEG